jgi:hypothetical protein
LIGALFLLFALFTPRRGFGLPIYLGVSVVSLLFFREVGTAFKRCQKEEFGDLDAAVGSIPKGQRVVGLVWERDSLHVRWSPYLHAAAMYQAERGGAVMFSFAEYPQSPFSFKANNRPPAVPLRWEWAAFFVRPVPDLDWFDYVITRGDQGTLKAYSDAFELDYDGLRWKVWKRRPPGQGFESGDAAYRLLNEAPEVKPEEGSTCLSLASTGKSGTLQAALNQVVLRARTRQGRCSVRTAEGRTCELELQSDPGSSGFDVKIEFTLKDGLVQPASLRCRGELPQPPM